MKRLFSVLTLSLGILVSSSCLSLSQTTITFDDLPSFAFIPNGYNGLNWGTNFFSLDPIVISNYSPSGYVNGIVSPNNVALNANEGPATFSSASTFTVNSMYITAAWREGLHVLLEGLASASVIHSLEIVIGSLTPTFVNLDWTDVDMVRISSSGGIETLDYPGSGPYVAIDDITINGEVSSVPEGSSIAMMLLGGLPVAFGVIRKRKRA
jgi:hypothetical protein